MAPMESLTFVFADRATVPGWLGVDVKEQIVQHILDIQPDKILLVTDQTVNSLHGEYLAGLRRGGEDVSGDAGASGRAAGALPELHKIILPCGDACKSWDNLGKLFEWAFSVGCTKRSLVVAFGGGALLNVTGLFASMLYRGQKLVYVPTTLLAMHDVTTSLKTSICFDGRKNNIGSFYAPLKILIDVAFCRTLPKAELFSGIGELAKNAALLGGKHADGFSQALSRERVDPEQCGSGDEFAIDEGMLSKLLELGIEAKMTILLTDAYERVSGMIFEYGHTVSHAIEKAYGDGVIPHGIGVTYGMLSSSYAAEKLGLMDPADRAEHDNLCWLLLQRWPLPAPRPSMQTIIELAMRDSKRGLTGEGPDEISDVLLRKMGDIVETKTNNLSKFPVRLIEEWLLQIGFPSEAPKSAKP